MVKDSPARPSSLVSRRSRGFTLLEVMVAVAIMAMVLVTLIGVKNRSMEDVLLAEHMTTATLLAKREMTDMLQNRANLPKENESEGEFKEEEYKDYTWKKTIAPLTIETGTGTLPVTIKELKVAVLWKEGGRDESVELVSYE
ncbi:MAG TPA: prepilin-type N-terminal cleavage/methylation domain-containing protein [Nitrospirota bacterium]|nr:prepilin-type N-terminal cleavage/methylation domain-containing protein [Nitrospirota bacterium]